jgi:hypothetical protein
LDLLIKWIDKDLTFDGMSTSKRYVKAQMLLQSLCQLVKKMISKVWIDLVKNIVSGMMKV